MRKRHLIFPLTAAFGLVVYFGLFNYKPFVDFVFEFGDSSTERFDPEASDVRFESTNEQQQTLSYEAEILQPSGISIRDDRMLIVTDTADVFLTDSTADILDSARLRGGPLLLRQGFTEGVTWIDDGSAAVIAGEGTKLLFLTVTDAEVSVERSVSLNLENPTGSEVQAIAYRETTGLLSLTIAEHDALRVVWLDGDGQVVDETHIDLPGVHPEQQDVQGSAIRDETLYLLLKRNILVEIDLLDNRVVAVAALDYDGDSSGLAVADDRVFVTTDHEYYEAPTTLQTFSLKNHAAG